MFTTPCILEYSKYNAISKTTTPTHTQIQNRPLNKHNIQMQKQTQSVNRVDIIETNIKITNYPGRSDPWHPWQTLLRGTELTK